MEDLLKFAVSATLVSMPLIFIYAAISTIRRDRKSASNTPLRTDTTSNEVWAIKQKEEKEKAMLRDEYVEKIRAEHAERQRHLEQEINKTMHEVSEFLKEDRIAKKTMQEVPRKFDPENLLKHKVPRKRAANPKIPAKSKSRKKLTEQPDGADAPKKVEISTTGFERSQEVKAWVLQSASGICESCNEPAPFTAKGVDYLEVHHVHPLASGGSDTIQNAVAICPNCHKALHHSDDKESMTRRLYAGVKRLVRE